MAGANEGCGVVKFCTVCRVASSHSRGPVVIMQLDHLSHVRLVYTAA